MRLLVAEDESGLADALEAILTHAHYSVDVVNNGRDALEYARADEYDGMMLDIICMWGFAVPLGLISAFVLKLSPILVYALMCTDEFAKMPFAVHHYFKADWIKNITREEVGGRSKDSF